MMKRFRKLKLVFSLLLLMCLFIGQTCTVAAAETMSDEDIISRLDFMYLDEITLNNGQTHIWDNGGNGFYLYDNVTICYQVNNSSPRTALVDAIVYKMQPDGRWTPIRMNSRALISSNTGYAMYGITIPETGQYAFGVKSYSLSPLALSSVVIMQF